MEEAAKIYQEDHQDVKIDIVEVGDVDVQSRLTTAATSGDLSALPTALVFFILQKNFAEGIVIYFVSNVHPVCAVIPCNV